MISLVRLRFLASSTRSSRLIRYIVAMMSSDSLGDVPAGRGLESNVIAVLAERPFLLEEHSGLYVAYPQRDGLLAAQALYVELDHRTALRSWPRGRVATAEAIAPGTVADSTCPWGGFTALHQGLICSATSHTGNETATTYATISNAIAD